VTGGITKQSYFDSLKSDDEWLRAWAIQLAFEDLNSLSRLTEERISEFDEQLLKTRLSLNELAASDPSSIVRLYLASALQRLPIDDRWDILTALVQHAEDASDHNLPLMYWYAAEPAVGQHPTQAITLLKKCRIPIVREFIARRLATASLKTVASK
jgi:hypothetical protein